MIGGDAAGGSAASQAKKRQSDLDVVMFERGPGHLVLRLRHPVLDRRVGRRARRRWSPARPSSTAPTGIDVRMRTEVVGIDLDRRTVQWRDLDGGGEGSEPFDDLVYATGSVPMRPPVPGIDAAGVYGVQVLDDGVALRDELDSGRVQRVVVVGGGYIGLEIAEACQVRGLDVTVVDMSATPVGTFDPDVGEFIAEAVRGEGITLVLSDGVAAVEVDADGRACAVVTASGKELPADLVVLGLGVRPNVRLAKEAGIPLGHVRGRRGRRPHAHQGRGRLVGGGLRRVPAPALRSAAGGRARHARQQAGPGRRHQHRRRLRDLPRRHRHGDHQDLRHRGGPHRAVVAGGRGRGLLVRHRERRLHDPGRVLPRGQADPGQDDRRAADRPAARRPGGRAAGRGQAHRRPGHLHLERDERRRDPVARPLLRAAVLAGLGPGADRRPQGVRRGGGRRR